jgi:hypothetical protein
MTDDLSDNTASAARPDPALRWLLAGLLAAPFAWLAQMTIAETLAAQSCYPHGAPLSAPVVPWLSPALIAVSAVCFLAGAAGSVIAWRNLRRIVPARQDVLTGERGPHSTLVRFLGHVAAMCSALFMFALIATDVALAIVSPCRGW